MKQEKNLRALVWLVFIIVHAFIKISYHELWKDEWQAWFVAKDKSISEIFSFLYYEGHPALWYLYLKMFTLFSSLVSPEWIIEFAHWLTVAAGLYILFLKLRLPVVLGILGALSYFMFFEYGVVNRGYFLVILFSFWASYLINMERYDDKTLAAVLFLLCQTEVYGVFIALALGLWIIMAQYRGTIIQNLKSPVIVGIISGLLIFVISVFPRTAGHVARTQGKTLTMTDQVLTSIQGNLSNTYFIGSTPDTFAYGWDYVGLLLSVCALVGLGLIFRKDKKLLVTYLAFLIMMIGFSIFFFTGGVRQWGIGFVFLFTMLGIRGFDWKQDKIAGIVIVIFCLMAGVHNLKAVKKEVRLPFTNAKAAGQFIKEKIPSKVPVVAINKFEATPVIGYAGRKFFELPDGVEFSYFRWVDKIYIPTESELKLFAQYKGVGGLVLISPKPLEADRFPNAKLWQKFDEENYKKENYYLYTLAK